MRSTRIHVRWGGLVAAAVAAVLSVPLSAIGPVQAAGPVDVSVTKTVASLKPPVAFDPAHRVVGQTGHEQWTIDGLRIWTDGSTSEDKVYEHISTSTPLADAEEPTLDYTTNDGNVPPGFRLMVDITGDGVSDGVLIGEPTYYGNEWWLSSASSATFKMAAPSCQNDPQVGTASSLALVTAGLCTGGNGSAWHGTLDQWRANLPSDATVVAFGFGLGSGVQGDYVITGLDFAGKHYDLRRSYKSTLKAAPGEMVEYKIAVANSGDATVNATGFTLTDVLPADLEYVSGSLSRDDWCDFVGQTLSCPAGVLPPGVTVNVYFKATISDTVSSAGRPSTIGHNIDVQKQEVFADLTAGRTKSFTAMCPSGYVATDGGLLLDAVDHGGYYSDIVVAKSKPTTVHGIEGWTVSVANFGEDRGQGKVKVTCLSRTTGSADGHSHQLDIDDSTGAVALTTDHSETVTAACPLGYTPIAPQHEVSSGIAVIRSSIAHQNTWRWTVDHEEGTAATFDVDCLAPETSEVKGHTATLPLNTATSTISVGAESRDEGIQGCNSNGHAITGGYHGANESVLSLGKEQRGTSYMFRFFNEDWDFARNAEIQVTCVGVRTADEPSYYHVVNTAYLTFAGGHPVDASTHDNTSSADISIVGDAVQPGGGVVVHPSGSRTGTPPQVKKVNLTFTCTEACAFSVKVLKGGVVVAKATKALSASFTPKTVGVPTTKAGRNLANNDVVQVKVKTSTGTTTTEVTL